MRRLLVVVALVIAGVATLLVAVGSARSPRPPGLIVFSDWAGETGVELYSIRPDGSGRVQLTHRAASADNPDLAADRRRIVFLHFDADTELIQVMTVGGTGPTVVAGGGENPKWSPDGRSIAYQVTPTYGGSCCIGATEIWVVRPDGTEPRNVIDPNELNSSSTYLPAEQAWDWSPDSSRIAFQTRYHLPGRLNDLETVEVVDLASGAVTRVGVGWNPDWSRRGDLIAFAQGRSILVAHPNGSGLRRVTAVPKDEGVYMPSWSHNGRRLAFYAMDKRERDSLYLVDSDGSHRVRVPLSTAGWNNWEAGQLRWSPDDSWLVFSDGVSLYRVRADGTSLARLTSGSSPDWE